MQVVEGDLLALAEAGQFDVIVHGCNCFHAMDAGIAQSIASRFPAALAADRATPYGDPAKLGTISTARAGRFTIVNAYTQFHWDGPPPLVDLEALSRAFRCIARRYPTARIGYPLIGAGLAGGDWRAIAPRIDAALTSCTHSLVIRPGTHIPRGSP